tara:strand:+ start:852 stop:1721 length:870 start_codon:yes stop_codon:yes gene_type:complete
MKASKKFLYAIISFFLIIIIVVTVRTVIGNYYKKKFSKTPDPGIIVAEVSNKNFSENIESFGTAISKKTKSFRIQKSNLVNDLNLKNYVNENEIIVELKDKNLIAPFSGILGYRGLTEDVLGTDNTFIITLDDNSVIYSDVKIPESFAPKIKKGLNVNAKISGNSDITYKGVVERYASRINAETRSLLTRVKIDNENYQLIPGSLLEITVKFDERISLGVPDTSIILEGDKIYVYKVQNNNSVEKKEITTGIRSNGMIEVLTGVKEGDKIVAEGLKKVNPKGKIKPILK